MDQNNELDMDDMIEYVQKKLMTQGFAVDKEALYLVFDYEMDYMVENGLAFPVDGNN